MKIENKMQNHQNSLRERLIFLEQKVNENQVVYSEFEDIIREKNNEASQYLLKIKDLFDENVSF